MNFVIQKLKSKHIFLKKYTSWAKLIYFSLVLRKWEEKKIKYFAPKSRSVGWNAKLLITVSVCHISDPPFRSQMRTWPPRQPEAKRPSCDGWKATHQGVLEKNRVFVKSHTFADRYVLVKMTKSQQWFSRKQQQLWFFVDFVKIIGKYWAEFHVWKFQLDRFAKNL